MLVISEQHGAEMMIIHRQSNTAMIFRLWQEVFTKKISGELFQEGQEFIFTEIPQNSCEESIFCIQHRKSQQFMFLYVTQDERNNQRHKLALEDPNINFSILGSKQWRRALLETNFVI